jgi:hypothetical protein
MEPGSATVSKRGAYAAREVDAGPGVALTLFVAKEASDPTRPWHTV